MADTEKTMDTKIQHIDDIDTVERVHVDGTVDLIDTKAIGGEVDELPAGYFRTPQFIGTVLVSQPIFLPPI